MTAPADLMLPVARHGSPDIGVDTSSPAPRQGVDFDRRVFCIGGLPIDALDMAEAVLRVREAALSGTRCVIATPNLNFVAAARTDADFRDSVCRSDLVLADGMPLVWIARLLGLPIRQRVSGAGLFEALCAHPGPAVTVYFYGGPPGAAAAACATLERQQGGLRCVGHESPPFASLDVLSGAETIDRINRSGAQFVIVALGAQKGQAWIERNRARLSAPVLCHLGAVINFAAGTVSRAPPLLQRAGLEWLWRIKEEPALWRRYWRDGHHFVALLVTRVLPYAARLRMQALLRVPQSRSELRVAHGPEGTTLLPSGPCTQAALGAFRAALRDAVRDPRPLKIDLRGVGLIDASFVALLMLAHAAFRGRLDIVGATSDLVRLLYLCDAEFLLQDLTSVRAQERQA